MKGFLFFFAVVTMVICFAIAAFAGDWQVFSGEIKPEAIYSVPENEVMPGGGVSLVKYKEKASLDFLFAPAKTIVGVGASYETDVMEKLFNIPEAFRPYVSDDVGAWAGTRDTFERDREFDWGFYATLLKIKI